MSERLFVVVLTWRDVEDTLACVASLRVAAPGWTIIVVDNESEGRLRERLGTDVRLIESAENLGFSRGVNLGIRAALDEDAEAVFVINNDATAEASSIDRIVARWRAEPDGGVFAPVIRYRDGALQSTGGTLRRATATTSDLGRGDLDYLTWAAVLLPRTTISAVGLLDEDFFLYWEDVEYGLRVRDAGLSLVLVEDAVVVHERSASHSTAGVAIDRHSARGLYLLAAKRADPVLWLGAVLRLAGRVAARGARGRWDAARAVVHGVGDARAVMRR